jgi:AbrB family looped-hinge helix DNA binding protein
MSPRLLAVWTIVERRWYGYIVLLSSYHRGPGMDTTRLSSKGQLVLPKAIREDGNWPEGTEFLVERVPEGVLLRPVRPFPRTRLENVIGSAGYRGPARSIDEMQRAIAKGVKERRGRGRY